MIVGVILHDDRHHVFEISVLGKVVVGGDNDAEGKFIKGANVVFFLVILILFFQQFVLIYGRNKGLGKHSPFSCLSQLLISYIPC